MSGSEDQKNPTFRPIKLLFMEMMFAITFPEKKMKKLLGF